MIVTYNLSIPKGDNLLYLLSAVSQGLAAIFALVFTITIFGAQMMRKFTSMDKIIDNWTKLLMILFAIGILLPLIQLRTDEIFTIYFIEIHKLILALSLGIATCCVLAIIPFLIKVNRTMKYEGGASKLCEEASEAIAINHHVTVRHRIDELTELANSAIDGILEKQGVNIVKILKKIAIETMGSQCSLDDMKYPIDKLKKIGIYSVTNKLDSISKEVLETLREIGTKKVEWIHNTKIVNGLKEIGLKAIETDLNNNIANQACNGIFDVSITFLLQRERRPYFEQGMIMLDSLKEIAIKANEINRSEFQKLFGNSILYLLVIESFMKYRLEEQFQRYTVETENQHFLNALNDKNNHQKAQDIINNLDINNVLKSALIGNLNEF